jgi:hypothetical protein
MSTPPAIRINDDFSASETGITLWSANNEEAGRLNLFGIVSL